MAYIIQNRIMQICEIDGIQYNMLDCMELREVFLR
jgi:hypothetical protein